MTTTAGEQELELLKGRFEKREAGVTELMELYEKTEAIYVQASVSISNTETIYTVDSTNSSSGDAYMG
ncbi:MAG: hypothetical protein OXG33_05815 [Chloroflexi bacterium]|nr:hypothetical protein [Chloroflexota bacterium]